MHGEAGSGVDGVADARIHAALAPDLEIQHLLGQGTTSRVYLARDVALDKLVTLKVLKPDAAASPEARARFEREARAAANILHPNVSAVYRFGVAADGQPFLVMQYVHGRTLKSLLAAEGPLTPEHTRLILVDVASALDAAHAQGVVHRDVRPDNILLEESSGRALVTDFGIAGLTEEWTHGRPSKLTATGQVLGDPRYVSPEQLGGGHVSESTDVYSLAIVGYEMLTGSLPLADRDRREAAIARLTGAPVQLPDHIVALDPGLADILRRCLAGDPNGRPTARSIASRLRPRQAVERGDDEGRPPLPPIPAWARRAWRALARRRVPQWVAAVGAAGSLVLALVGDLGQNLGLPAASYGITLVTALAAIVAAAVLAWFHGERGEQRFTKLELSLLAVIAAAWIGGLAAILL